MFNNKKESPPHLEKPDKIVIALLGMNTRNQ